MLLRHTLKAHHYPSQRLSGAGRPYSGKLRGFSPLITPPALGSLRRTTSSAQCQAFKADPKGQPQSNLPSNDNTAGARPPHHTTPEISSDDPATSTDADTEVTEVDLGTLGSPLYADLHAASLDHGAPDDDHMISFLIPVPSPDTPASDVLECPTIRHLLTPRDSPWMSHNCWGGGFVDDEDRVALNTLKLATRDSAGATDMCISLPLSDTVDEADEGGDAAAPASSSSCSSNGAGAPVGSVQACCQGSHAGSGEAAAMPESTRRSVNAEVAAIAAAKATEAACHPGQNTATSHTLHLRTGHMDRLCVPLPSWGIRAGPRKVVYFKPSETNAAIVTCGHLCPGINDVILGLVKRLSDYGVPDGNILGIRYGFKGFSSSQHKPVVLTPKSIDNIQLKGGTMLGTTRGGYGDVEAIVRRLELWNIGQLFVVGGDGGNRVADAIHWACQERDLACAVVGVPKSIENDLLLIDRTFGFGSAVEEASRVLQSAKVEASSALNGIAIVKMMGRTSGFVAMQASMAAGEVDVCLIPEVKFQLEGRKGLFAYVESILQRQGHCVIAVAEGAGQDLIREQHGLEGPAGQSMDAAGNPVLKDVGIFLKHRLQGHFGRDGADVVYLDPTYMLRAIPSNSQDHIYCRILAQAAVDAAFAGYSGVTVAQVNTHFSILPTPVITQSKRRVDPFGKAWNRLRASIGQPNFHD